MTITTTAPNRRHEQLLAGWKWGAMGGAWMGKWDRGAGAGGDNGTTTTATPTAAASNCLQGGDGDGDRIGGTAGKGGQGQGDHDRTPGRQGNKEQGTSGDEEDEDHDETMAGRERPAPTTTVVSPCLQGGQQWVDGEGMTMGTTMTMRGQRRGG